MTLTYGSYLKVDELLQLQQLQSDPPEHDELLFIIIHQTYELWFKQVLHEMGKLRSNLSAGETWGSAKTYRRILTIFKTLVSQIDILETMTPLEFISFRKFLASSSGFQSWQFREVEILCGMHSPVAIELQKSVPQHYQRLLERMQEPTLWYCFIEYLNTRQHQLPLPVPTHSEGLIYSGDEQLQEKLADIIRKDPEASLVSELMVDFDEGLQEWRYRHVKMVERTIGSKPGSGGSPGASYLRSTLHRSIFPDLWAVRAHL
ncbi:tryptophan 2,3-dioxygenase [Aestuariicella hydrocarbonica]|uniref:Tryptophan 2,3-dioxygenase n=1 Tax=Pseudomaricurvus hydrocarbonicus TaxID=1470433 RepID=A0A9E5JXV7_9GAMM|nr:tryptophan 2,3-dioxygenase family protein [Aestuariicella hydrocarbonica]NHO66611.1 tryptophan 2,3-dioxygenase [Aestuariicella hydrocarbonica]